MKSETVGSIFFKFFKKIGNGFKGMNDCVGHCLTIFLVSRPICAPASTTTGFEGRNCAIYCFVIFTEAHLFFCNHILYLQVKVTLPSLSTFLNKYGALHFGHGVSSISPKIANLHFG